MTVDPAFGLLIAVPIMIAALGAAIVASSSRRAAPVIAVCGMLAFVVGCGSHKDDAGGSASSNPTPSSIASLPTETPHLGKLTQSEITAARIAKPSGMVSIDVLDMRADGTHHDAITVAPREKLHVIGWAYLEPRMAQCEAVGLLVDGKTVYPGLYGYARPDVASFYKDPARTNVGYSIEVAAARLGAGAHKATVVCVASPGLATRYANPVQITVR